MTRPRAVALHDFLFRRGTVLAVAVFIGVGGLGLANGGYFPISWGWSAAGFLALGLIALAANEAHRPGMLGSALLGLLLLLTVWTAASALWSLDVTHTVDEVERGIVYVAAAAGVLALLREDGERAVLLGVWAAISVLCIYGLAIWLFPQYLGYEDAASRVRLSAPLGYSNAFGVAAAMGILLALGFAAHASSVLLRALAAASAVVMVTTLYFSFSRGAWIALGFGIVAMAAADRRRLLLLTVGFLIAPSAALAVWFASRSEALTHSHSAISAIGHEGQRMAALVILLAAAAAFAVLVFDTAASRIFAPLRVLRAYGVVLGLVVAIGLSAVFVRYGSPTALARHAYRSFNGAPPTTNGAMNSRLFSLSSDGRGDQFHTAWQEAEEYPWLGSGAGTFDIYWFQHREATFDARDVHNLYLETLAELGPIGLALLAGVLAVPLVAIVRARARPLAAAAFGAYVTFLLHAAFDWDWEMPAVTLAALFSGLSLLACLRRAEGRSLSRWPRIVGAAVVLGVSGFVVLTLLGNIALSASSTAKDGGNYVQAQSDARRAMDFLPWSVEPQRRLGEAQAGANEFAAARVSFRRAIAKEPKDWTLWFDLAQVSSGSAQRIALARALRLNPRSPEIAAWKASH